MGYIARPYPKKKKKLNQGLVIKTHRNHHNFVRTKDKKTGPFLNNKINKILSKVLLHEWKIRLFYLFTVAAYCR